MWEETVNVLGVSGSLRKGSFNTGLLRAAVELAPRDMKVQIFDLSPIPLYNEDVRALGFPEPVKEFRDRIASADALLIATPEYNHSISGVLKNAIDWASRPPGPPLLDKPVAIMGASPGNFGSVRAQSHLRLICDALMRPVARPEVIVMKAQEKFDADGKLVDETTRGIVKELLIALAEWTRLLSRGSLDSE
ncbi:MAG TPA: NADPH-dependent FMN reductase [Candidatus Acidoferrum sp.]|nr:NADPH-dependent FMN reductase [Candidatus Acidoferrum sp.]